MFETSNKLFPNSASHCCLTMKWLSGLDRVDFEDDGTEGEIGMETAETTGVIGTALDVLLLHCDGSGGGDVATRLRWLVFPLFFKYLIYLS